MALVIGIIYDRDENWIAGSYYIENLISALAILKGEKPILKIYSKSRESFEGLKAKTRYPDLNWVELKDQNTFFDRLINKISFIFFQKHWIIRGIDSKVDILFPGSDTYLFEKIQQKLYWIPDFQEKHFPDFFGKVELNKRKSFQDKLVKGGWPVVFSSFHAFSDFKELYPLARNKTFVVPFAVTIPNLEGIKIEQLKEKYRIVGNYFICSNQFWRHKNHLLVLNAILKLKQDGLEVSVVFTGLPHDPRNPAYYETLEDFVSNNQLNCNVQFLGFIDRKDQLILMKHSMAVIQPSLFEGWSTVVEDAKALNTPVLVSDIPVHREQIKGDSNFFMPDDHIKLSELMASSMREKRLCQYEEYEISVSNFGTKMINSVKEILGS